MVLDVEFFTEASVHWPARDGRPAQDAYQAFVLDRTLPARYALRKMFVYRLSDSEVQAWKGKLEGQAGRLAVTSIGTGAQPVLQGEIISVGAPSGAAAGAGSAAVKR